MADKDFEDWIKYEQTGQILNDEIDNMDEYATTEDDTDDTELFEIHNKYLL